TLSTNEDFARAFRQLLDCQLATSKFSCNVVRYEHLSLQEANSRAWLDYAGGQSHTHRASRACKIASSNWNRVISSTPEGSFYLDRGSDVAGIFSACLASGQGISQDFVESRRIAKWYFLSGLHGSISGGIALAGAEAFASSEENSI